MQEPDVKPQIANLEAEQALLGALLCSNLVLRQTQELDPLDFFEPVHQRIYAAILESIAADKTANPVTLKPQFDQDAALSGIGGGAYLAKLAGCASMVLDYRQLAQTLRELAMFRRIYALCSESLFAIGERWHEKKPEECLGNLIADLQKIGTSSASLKPKTDIDVAREILQDQSTVRACYPSNLRRLDDAMGGGFYAGRFYGFAARMKVGKTVLASTFSHNLAMQGVKHSFVAAEMGSAEIHQRILARLMGVKAGSFVGEYGSTDAFRMRLSGVTHSLGGNILYHDEPGISFDRLRQIISADVQAYGIKGVILDYWQLVGGKARNQSTAEHLEAVAQWLADFGRKHRVFMVVFAQINQDGNTRGSEGIRLACDQLYQIHREDLGADAAWLEMMATRYTPWANVGSDLLPGLLLSHKGPFFEDAA